MEPANLGAPVILRRLRNKLSKPFICWLVYSSMIKVITVCLLIGFAIPALAQYSDSTHHYASYVSSGSINKANGDRAYLLNNTLKLGLKKKSISLNFNNNWIYGKQNNNITNNDFSSTMDFNLYKTFPHFFYWGLANYNTSYSLKITDQLLTGAGIAYSVLERPNAYLNFSDGLLYDYSNLTLSNGNPDRYSTSRNSFRLTYRFMIRQLIEVSGTNFLQHSLTDQQDYIIKTSNKVSFKINKWISLLTQLDYNKMNRTHGENLLLSYGLNFERYF